MKYENGMALIEDDMMYVIYASVTFVDCWSCGRAVGCDLLEIPGMVFSEGNAGASSKRKEKTWPVTRPIRTVFTKQLLGFGS